MFERYRHAQLLVALTLLLIANPFLSGLLGRTLISFFLLLSLVSAIAACARRRRELAIGVGLALAMQTTLLVHYWLHFEVAGPAMSLLALAFFGFVIVLVSGSVFRHSHSVSMDTICGGLSVYLLLGVFWAFAYALLESLAPGSFIGIERLVDSTHYEKFFGYSFVTLTTLGYGNVIPVTPRAESLAIAEAIVGQIFLTVLVARLVALNLRHGEADVDGGVPDPTAER